VRIEAGTGRGGDVRGQAGQRCVGSADTLETKDLNESCDSESPDVGLYSVG